MSERLRRVTLELLTDGRLVVFANGASARGPDRTVFRQPIEAAIFLQLLVNQLQLEAGERPDERAPSSSHATDAPAPGAP